MKGYKLDITFFFKTLIVLLLTNYMIVTIICKDIAVLKYLRDFNIFILLIMSLRDKKLKWCREWGLLIVFTLMVLIAVFHATSLNVGVVAARRYLLPVLMYYVSFYYASNKNVKSIMKFVLPFLAVLSTWGIFQAYVLKDTFLKSLGYPQAFLPAYGRYMLHQAFYFGNLGIQRVTATLSSPNIFALILGCTIIFVLINREYLTVIKHWKIYLSLICMAYVATVSRSNFVAMFVVTVIILWPYIPYKKTFIGLGTVAIAIFIFVGHFQNGDGIAYKLIEWVKNSLMFKESSAAGRSSRWLAAFQEIKENPFGLGPGYVGSIATNAGRQELYLDCENSYLCLALDIGVIGCIAYYLFLVIEIIRSNKLVVCYKGYLGNREIFDMNKSVVCILIYVMIVMFFSNHVQDMEAMIFIFMYMGLVRGRTNKYRIDGE